MSGNTMTPRDATGNTTVTLKVPALEADRWDKEAAIAGVTRSEWIRRRCACPLLDPDAGVHHPLLDSDHLEPSLMPLTTLPAREFRGPDPKPTARPKKERRR